MIITVSGEPGAGKSTVARALAQALGLRYLSSGEPFDKAGAYAIQGRAGRYIPRIEGCYYNVVGLPLARLCNALVELGWSEEWKTEEALP